ncbi:hypothetical protein [Longimicrobium sp.]|jgi:hypothetical protein|uniref:type II toxin-antitoxin system VapB family antitoxin n=1 Tax=Longimicrobium sp. TaxID=2029185 RepID=UPI002F92C904
MMMIKNDRDDAAPHQDERASADEEQALEALRGDLRAIQSSYVSLPVLDDRHADEILGYDEHGLPTCLLRGDSAGALIRYGAHFRAGVSHGRRLSCTLQRMQVVSTG